MEEFSENRIPYKLHKENDKYPPQSKKTKIEGNYKSTHSQEYPKDHF